MKPSLGFKVLILVLGSVSQYLALAISGPDEYECISFVPQGGTVSIVNDSFNSDSDVDGPFYRDYGFESITHFGSSSFDNPGLDNYGYTTIFSGIKVQATAKWLLVDWSIRQQRGEFYYTFFRDLHIECIPNETMYSRLCRYSWYYHEYNEYEHGLSSDHFGKAFQYNKYGDISAPLVYYGSSSNGYEAVTFTVDEKVESESRIARSSSYFCPVVKADVNYRKSYTGEDGFEYIIGYLDVTDTNVIAIVNHDYATLKYRFAQMLDGNSCMMHLKPESAHFNDFQPAIFPAPSGDFTIDSHVPATCVGRNALITFSNLKTITFPPQINYIVDGAAGTRLFSLTNLYFTCTELNCDSVIPSWAKGFCSAVKHEDEEWLPLKLKSGGECVYAGVASSHTGEVALASAVKLRLMSNAQLPIKYTLDGDVPDADSQTYTSALRIDEPRLVRFALMAGQHYMTSVHTVRFVGDVSLSLPEFDSGSRYEFHASNSIIRVTNIPVDCELRITRDGREPTWEDEDPGTDIYVSETCQIKACFYTCNGLGRGPVACVDAIRKWRSVLVPTCNLPSDITIPFKTNVIFQCETSDVELRYTLDGSDPTIDSLIYDAPVQIADTVQIKVRAFKSDYAPSDVLVINVKREWPRVETPVIDYGEEESFDYSNKDVRISCATEGASLYYTLDGTDPLERGVKYTGVLTISENVIIRVIAVKDDYQNSEIEEVALTRIWNKVRDPIIIPGDGSSFTGQSQLVRIECAEKDVEITYMLDGGLVDTYRGPFRIDKTRNITAWAAKPDWQVSDRVSATITKHWWYGDGVNLPDQCLVSKGDAEWVRDTSVSHDGVESLRSGTIEDGQSSCIEMIAPSDGNVSFWWKVSCEDDQNDATADWDHLEFSTNGVVVKAIDGIRDWQQVVCLGVTAGTKLTWCYIKDDSESSGDDCGWIDEIKIFGGLLHRWSFNGTLEDSVGGSDAKILGGSSWARDGRVVSLSGGSHGTSGVDLGANLLPVDGTPVTIEIWAKNRVVRNWSRIFDMGVGTNASGNGNDDDFLMSWCRGVDSLTDRIEIWNNWTSLGELNEKLSPYKLDCWYHIGIVIEPNRDGDGQSAFTFVKHDLSDDAATKVFSWKTGCSWSIADLRQNVFYLGRSSWVGDDDASADYDEVRIWNCALSVDELAQSALAGPDADVENADQFTVSFDAVGGSAKEATRRVLRKARIGSLPDASKSGCDLVGWFTAAEGGELVTSETVVLSDMVVYAHWQPAAYVDANVGKSVTGLDEPVVVPASWVTETLVQRYGSGKADVFRQQFGNDLAIALATPTGKVGPTGEVRTVWDDYVAGTDPTDPTSIFRTLIKIVDGKVVLDWSPNLNLGSTSRLYRVKGKVNLSDLWSFPAESGHRFFTTEVSLPDGKTQTSEPGVIDDTLSDGRDISDKLAHRWSFNGSLGDSVGGYTANAVGKISTDGSCYTLSGDWDVEAYIEMGTGLFAEGVTEFTIEVWVTPYSTGWRRIWDIADQFGQCWNGAENLMGVRDHVWWTSYTAGEKAYVSVVCSTRSDGGWDLTYYHFDALKKQILSSYYSTTTGSDWSPQKVSTAMCYLGKSDAPQDPYGDASYDEFRIWNTALTAEEVEKSVKNGPDALPFESASK